VYENSSFMLLIEHITIYQYQLEIEYLCFS